MNVFCIFIQSEIQKKFISKKRKKKMVHFAFDEPVVSHRFCHNIMEIVSTRWEERKMLFAAMKWFIQKLINLWNGKMAIFILKEKKMERKKIIEDIADNILGCLKEEYSPRHFYQWLT